jgi:hypothetical protein
MNVMAKANGSNVQQFAPVASNNDDDLELLDAQQIATLFKVPVGWVRRSTQARAKHPMPHIKVGHYTRFQESAVRSWLQAQKKNYPGTKR